MAMKRWMTMAGVVGLLFAALNVSGVEAASKTLYVGTCKGSSPYTTIQSAVDAVNDDDFTIYVCPGTYNESVQVMNKEELTIRNYVVKNQAAPLIDPSGSDAFDVTDSKEVTIRGLRITNAGTGIFAINSPETEVRNVLISASFIGIYFVDGSDKSEAQDNTITNGFVGGIGAQQSKSVTIKGNTINNVNDGVGVFGADKTKVESNSMTNGSDIGIIMQGATRASLKKNTTSFYVSGIVLEGSSSNTISDGTAKGNSDSGVFVSDDSTGNTFKKNFIQGNGTDAVDLSSGSKTAGTANTWKDNKCDTSVPNDLCGSSATARRAAITAPSIKAWPHR